MAKASFGLIVQARQSDMGWDSIHGTLALTEDVEESDLAVMTM